MQYFGKHGGPLKFEGSLGGGGGGENLLGNLPQIYVSILWHNVF